MKELEKRRGLYSLGQRAIDYYVDTGFCVFCDADDVAGIPHDGDDDPDDSCPCLVGKLSGVEVDEKRKKAKLRERTGANNIIRKMIAERDKETK